jgi:hypothetical protein
MSDLTLAVLGLAGSLFAASATAKLRSRRAYRSFRDEIRGTGLLPTRQLPAGAALLAAAEAVMAAGLLAAVGLTAAGPGLIWPAELALAAATILAAVLTAGVAVAVRRGTRARCVCFGARSERPLGRMHLVRNLSLLAAVSAGLAGAALARGRPSPPEAAVAFAVGVVAALLFIRWEDLAELVMPISPHRSAAPAVARSPRGRR